MSSPQILFVVGPTAVGKTDVGFLLAKRLNGEVVSCDSMQVYKELSILSSKPAQKMMDEVPHYLIGTVSINQDFDVARYRKLALKIIATILKRKKIPVFVGGSGLYMSILLDGIFEGQSADQHIRQRLMAEAEDLGVEQLYQRLKNIDAKAAQKIHPNDAKRIIRALEVYEIHQKPISELQKNRRGLFSQYDVKIFALNRDREELYRRINQRVDDMFEEGAVNEIQGLSKKRWSQTSKGLIGVPEIQGYLAGQYDLEKTKYLIKLNTRHLAKRQLTWFRKDKRLHWVMIENHQTPLQVVEKMMKEMGS